MTESKARPVSKTLLIVISLIVIAIVALTVTGIHLSNPYLHKKVVEMSSSRSFTSIFFPERGSRVPDWPCAMRAAPTCRP